MTPLNFLRRVIVRQWMNFWDFRKNQIFQMIAHSDRLDELIRRKLSKLSKKSMSDNTLEINSKLPVFLYWHIFRFNYRPLIFGEFLIIFARLARRGGQNELSFVKFNFCRSLRSSFTVKQKTRHVYCVVRHFDGSNLNTHFFFILPPFYPRITLWFKTTLAKISFQTSLWKCFLCSL